MVTDFFPIFTTSSSRQPLLSSPLWDLLETVRRHHLTDIGGLSVGLGAPRPPSSSRCSSAQMNNPQRFDFFANHHRRILSGVSPCLRKWSHGLRWSDKMDYNTKRPGERGEALRKTFIANPTISQTAWAIGHCVCPRYQLAAGS